MTMGSMPSARIIGRNLPEASLQARSGSKPRGWRRRRSTSCRSVPPISKRETVWRTRRAILAEENGHRAGGLEGACPAQKTTPDELFGHQAGQTFTAALQASPVG